MPARRVTSVTVTKLLLDVLFWVSGIAAVLFTLFLVLSPLAMHDGFVADAAFPVSIGEGTVRTILPLTVDTVASPGVQRAVIVDARGELRLQTTRWPLQFLPNLGMLLALWLAIYIIYLMRGILRRVKDGDPFAAQNVRSLQIIGTLLLALGLFGPVLEYAIVRSLLSRLALGGVDLTAPIDMQTNTTLAGLLVLVLAGVFRHGADLERDQALTV
jgi:hypothetical protein